MDKIYTWCGGYFWEFTSDQTYKNDLYFPFLDFP